MAQANQWTAADIPDQSGKFAVVTGGNGGLGFETVKELTRKRAQVVLACRNVDKGNAARAQLLETIPDAQIEVMPLDLASFASVRGLMVQSMRAAKSFW